MVLNLTKSNVGTEMLVCNLADGQTVEKHFHRVLLILHEKEAFVIFIE